MHTYIAMDRTFTAAFAYNTNNWKQMSLRVKRFSWSNEYLSAHQVLIYERLLMISMNGKGKLKNQYANNFVYRKKAELSTCGDTESVWQVPSVRMLLTLAWDRARGGNRGTAFFFFCRLVLCLNAYNNNVVGPTADSCWWLGRNQPNSVKQLSFR